eukprot:8881029-Pyramimonas_sp.AAC.1
MSGATHTASSSSAPATGASTPSSATELSAEALGSATGPSVGTHVDLASVASASTLRGARGRGAA